jgi:hypothetical protein
MIFPPLGPLSIAESAISLALSNTYEDHDSLS